jgi:hypothetical protein
MIHGSTKVKNSARFIIDYTCVVVKCYGVQIIYCFRRWPKKWTHQTVVSGIDASGGTEISTFPEIITACIFRFQLKCKSCIIVDRWGREILCVETIPFNGK